jgi:hypothetical protein
MYLHKFLNELLVLYSYIVCTGWQFNSGVAEKHDFRGIQRKIPQASDFAKNRDLNPPPHGDTATDIAKMFAKNFLRKSDFG